MSTTQEQQRRAFAPTEDNNSDSVSAYVVDEHALAPGLGDSGVHYSNPIKEAPEGIASDISDPIKKESSSHSDADVDHQDNKEGSNAVMRAINYVVPRGGLLAGAFNMASVTFGAGVMSIPSAFNTAGVLVAILYLILITSLTVFSIVLLVKVSEKTGLRSFEGLARGLFGRGGDIFVAVIMWLLCFGGAAGYVVATGDIFKAVLSHDGVPHFLTTAWGRRCLVCGVWFFFMLPVALPKRVNSLRYVSAIGVTFIVFFVFCVVGHSASVGMPYVHDLAMARSGNSAVSAVSIFIFSYLCQVNCFKIYYEMPKPNVWGIAKQATLSCGMCGTLYFLIGFFGYAEFGRELDGNILNYYDIYKAPIFFVCYIGIIVKLVASFSQNMLACRTALFQVCNWDVDTMPYWKHTLFAGSFAVGALILGLFVPDINIVFGLAGAFCGGFIGFVFPALFTMYAGKWNRETVGWVQYIATYFLLLCGVVGVCFGTISTVYSTIKKYS